MPEEFDACEYKMRQLAIRVAKEVRKIKGEPEEKNISILYDEAAVMLGLPRIRLSSMNVNHLPSPAEMKDNKGEFVIPNKPCPRCGKTAFLSSICRKCKESEDGKYKSGYICDDRHGGCGFIDDKSEEYIIRRLSHMGVEFPTGLKSDIGIGTITDEGVK